MFTQTVHIYSKMAASSWKWYAQKFKVHLKRNFKTENTITIQIQNSDFKTIYKTKFMFFL